MNDAQQKAIDELRADGYAVIIWTPDELRGASPTRIEDIGIERTSEAIEDLADQ